MSTTGEAERLVTTAWVDIEAWLRRHAPRTAEALAGPASPEAIASAEEAMGTRFPAELIGSLTRHDGLTPSAYAGGFSVLPDPPLSVAQIVQTWRDRVDIATHESHLDIPRPGEAEPWWHSRWIPWAGRDGYLKVIDMRPGPDRGRLGDGDTTGIEFGLEWPHVGAYLRAVADALLCGGPVGSWHPYLTGEEELWWDAAGATELRGAPLGPAIVPPASRP